MTTLEDLQVFCKSKPNQQTKERFSMVDHLENSLKPYQSMNWLLDQLLH